MKFPAFLFVICCILNAVAANSQRLDFFTSQTGNLTIQGSDEKIPYDETAGFFDFIPEGSLPDSIEDGKPFYYVYFILPVEVTEIGIRMISPVPAYAFAEAGDEVTEAYESNKRSTTYFNPWIALEFLVPEKDSTTSEKIQSWMQLGANEDSQELMAQPSGDRTNALLRVYQGPYPAGTYRVKFKTGKKGNSFGSYLLQTGTVPGIKRLKMSRAMNHDN